MRRMQPHLCRIMPTARRTMIQKRRSALLCPACTTCPSVRSTLTTALVWCGLTEHSLVPDPHQTSRLVSGLSLHPVLLSWDEDCCSVLRSLPYISSSSVPAPAHSTARDRPLCGGVLCCLWSGAATRESYSRTAVSL